MRPDDYSNNLSKIEFRNQSINSSIRDLSQGEDFIQKDILLALNCPNNVSDNFLVYYFRKKMETVSLITKFKNYLWRTLFIVREVKILF